jgi:hypothetical protein
MYGNLDCLKYARENGCPWNFSKLILVGNIECLQYIISNEKPVF